MHWRLARRLRRWTLALVAVLAVPSSTIATASGVSEDLRRFLLVSRLEAFPAASEVSNPLRLEYSAELLRGSFVRWQEEVSSGPASACSNLTLGQGHGRSRELWDLLRVLRAHAADVTGGCGFQAAERGERTRLEWYDASFSRFHAFEFGPDWRRACPANLVAIQEAVTRYLATVRADRARRVFSGATCRAQRRGADLRDWMVARDAAAMGDGTEWTRALRWFADGTLDIQELANNSADRCASTRRYGLGRLDAQARREFRRLLEEVGVRALAGGFCHLPEDGAGKTRYLVWRDLSRASRPTSFYTAGAPASGYEQRCSPEVTRLVAGVEDLVARAEKAPDFSWAAGPYLCSSP